MDLCKHKSVIKETVLHNSRNRKDRIINNDRRKTQENRKH